MNTIVRPYALLLWRLSVTRGDQCCYDLQGFREDHVRNPTPAKRRCSRTKKKCFVEKQWLFP